ncbi:Uncharacterised protein r2_g4053 [Pycnogonum litorale]
MSAGKSCYKYCCVPECKSTTIRDEEKIFVSVPDNPTTRKNCLMQRNAFIVCKRTSYCCGDHFDMMEDMENYMEHNLSGVRLRVKKDAVSPRTCLYSRPWFHYARIGGCDV